MKPYNDYTLDKIRKLEYEADILRDDKSCIKLAKELAMLRHDNYCYFESDMNDARKYLLTALNINIKNIDNPTFCEAYLMLPFSKRFSDIIRTKLFEYTNIYKKEAENNDPESCIRYACCLLNLVLEFDLLDDDLIKYVNNYIDKAYSLNPDIFNINNIYKLITRYVNYITNTDIKYKYLFNQYVDKSLTIYDTDYVVIIIKELLEIYQKDYKSHMKNDRYEKCYDIVNRYSSFFEPEDIEYAKNILDM